MNNFWVADLVTPDFCTTAPRATKKVVTCSLKARDPPARATVIPVRGGGGPLLALWLGPGHGTAGGGPPVKTRLDARPEERPQARGFL